MYVEAKDTKREKSIQKIDSDTTRWKEGRYNKSR
jgi:hypothetical protein